MTNLEEDIFGEWLFNCYGKHDKILTWCSQKVPLRGPCERPLDTQNRSFRTFVYTTLNCKLCQFWDFITRLHENFASILGKDESNIQCKTKNFFVSLSVSNSVFFFFNGTLSLSFGFCLSGFFSHFYYFEGPTSIYFFSSSCSIMLRSIFGFICLQRHLSSCSWSSQTLKYFFQSWHCDPKVKKLRKP